MEKPLHVRVVEALGCKPKFDSLFSGIEACWHCTCPERDHTSVNYHDYLMVVHYDTDWGATGPLIEKYGITLLSEWGGFHGGSTPFSHWMAASDFLVIDCEVSPGLYECAETPLIAVCHLILKLAEAGKLDPVGGVCV